MFLSLLDNLVIFLYLFMSQAPATPILATTMECAGRRGARRSNVTVPNLSRERNAREVWINNIKSLIALDHRLVSLSAQISHATFLSQGPNIVREVCADAVNVY